MHPKPVAKIKDFFTKKSSGPEKRPGSTTPVPTLGSIPKKKSRFFGRSSSSPAPTFESALEGGNAAAIIARRAADVAQKAATIAVKAAEIAQGFGTVEELAGLERELKELGVAGDVDRPSGEVVPELEKTAPPVAIGALAGPTLGQVRTCSHVSDTVFSKFVALHGRRPNHPIFGEPEKGKIRAPLQMTGRNRYDWKSKCDNLGASVERQMGKWITPGSCWMKKDQSMSFQKKDSEGRPYLLVTFLAVRLLAFLNDPSDSNWQVLTGQLEGASRSHDAPFTHFCHNGHASTGGDAGCVNGIEHGRFATPQENNEQRKCKGRDRGQCPGHGKPQVHCIYVHADGVRKPCKNFVEGPPSTCACERKCF